MHRPRQLRILPQLTRDGTITKAVLPQGASDVQSIRTSQTADSRAKQTRCSSPARRSARVNSRSGDGDSPGSAFSFEGSGGEFSEPAPFSWPSSARVAAQNLARQWIGVDISPKAVELVNMRLQQSMGNLFRNRLVTARTDIDVPVPYRQTMHVRFGQQEGRCTGRPVHRVSQRVPVPRPRSGPHHPPGGGGQDNIDNLQLLRTHCNRVKRDWPQEYLNQYQGGMCISRVLKTTERTLILQAQISSRPLLDRRRYLTIPVLGLLQFAPQPQTNGTFGE